MDVRAVTAADLPALIALIADYQRFYAGSARDDAHNAFFGRFERVGERSAWFEYEIATRV